MGLFDTYRRGAGKRARSAASLMLLFMLAWMSYTIVEYGNTKLDRLLGLESHPFWGRALVGGGALTEWVTPSLIVALIVFGLGMLWLRSYLNRPGVADLLISTEAELRKVRWAPRKDVQRATIVTLYYVAWFALIVFIMDLTFSFGVGVMQRQDWKTVGWGRVVTMVFRLEPPTKKKPTPTSVGDES